ncbi:MAG TPA: PKD domain-containing protein [Bacteroidales bacterium]|nr:PKD domain-containing protein [Bacteroidales bacterium]
MPADLINNVMVKRKVFLVLLISLLSLLTFGQTETYKIEKAYFSSDKFDEFSPVYFNDGIVFCSNRNLGLASHSSKGNKTLFKIYYIDTVKTRDWEGARLFSKDITTIYNDGPVTFNKTRDTIYYSRNQDVSSKFKDILDQRNYLGIFYAVFVDGKWQRIRDLRINNEWYNVTTPFLSPDGKRLYFASDKPGGYGGSDLYYSEWKDDRWNDPVNLGPVINTTGNESYPFVSSTGELFFSSDGHPGHGGKDIYFSIRYDTTWTKPVDLDAPVNSSFDDFGITTDAEMNEGYFSSNRDRTIDIFHFRTISPQALYNIPQKENEYCFIFSDTGDMVIDTLNLKYVWNFGDGSRAYSAKTHHCYKQPGNYSVKLDVVDRATGNLFFSKLSYKLKLTDYIQPYITSVDYALTGEVIAFDGLKSSLPGYKILSFTWDFGDGTKGTGVSINHAYRREGTYTVNLGLTIQSEATGFIRRTGITKTIRIFDNNKAKVEYMKNNSNGSTELKNIMDYENAGINILFSAESKITKDAVFWVRLFAPGKKLYYSNPVFDRVPKKYRLTEKFNPEDSTYSYCVDQQMSIMATYPAYKELLQLGYKDVSVQLLELKDPAEKELFNLKQINGTFADDYFDQADHLTTNAYIMLDQIVKLMNRYPSVRMEIDVHTDSQGLATDNIKLSQTRAQLLASYMISRGIQSNRLVVQGFGSSKPIASNMYEKDRKLNRRIDFLIISK